MRLVDDEGHRTPEEVTLAMEERFQRHMLGLSPLRTPGEMRTAHGAPLTGSGPAPQIVNGTVTTSNPKRFVRYGALGASYSTFDADPLGWVFTPGASKP